MRLTAWEEERLLIFTAAELARRHRAAGLRLNQPEAVALICDAMFEAARAGASYEQVETAVRELIDEVRLEVLLGDGTRLVVLVDPLGGGRPLEQGGPGAVRLGEPVAGTAPTRERIALVVRNTSQRTVRVSSHYPFERVNARLEFDRSAAAGFRLDLPPGAHERWEPGETRTVNLVRYGGRIGAADPGTPER